MALEILGALLGIAGAISKLVALGFKLVAAEEDMRAASDLLAIISDTAEHVRTSRDKLSSHLTFDQKQRIGIALDRTERLLDVSNKALHRRETTSGSGGGEMSGLSDKLIWVFRDKGMVVTYQTVLGSLHGVLLAISTELGMLRNIYTDLEPNPPSYVDVFYSEGSRSAIVTGIGTYVATPDMENGELYSPGCMVTITDDLKKTYMERAKRAQLAKDKLEATEWAATGSDVEDISITADLKRRYTQRAMREYKSDQSGSESEPESILKDLKRRYSERAARWKSDADPVDSDVLPCREPRRYAP